mmetsp:Transcript_23214/g.79841  ORF Transcript_23214/g.79841 Transcript_23214/m.79841 type:complete len:368 (+) Transcript_23214:613-1716(+)
MRRWPKHSRGMRAWSRGPVLVDVRVEDAGVVGAVDVREALVPPERARERERRVAAERVARQIQRRHGAVEEEHGERPVGDALLLLVRLLCHVYFPPPILVGLGREHRLLVGLHEGLQDRDAARGAQPVVGHVQRHEQLVVAQRAAEAPRAAMAQRVVRQVQRRQRARDAVEDQVVGAEEVHRRRPPARGLGADAQERRDRGDARVADAVVPEPQKREPPPADARRAVEQPRRHGRRARVAQPAGAQVQGDEVERVARGRAERLTAAATRVDSTSSTAPKRQFSKQSAQNRRPTTVSAASASSSATQGSGSASAMSPASSAAKRLDVSQRRGPRNARASLDAQPSSRATYAAATKAALTGGPSASTSS